jgi:hypothetical protein
VPLLVVLGVLLLLTVACVSDEDRAEVVSATATVVPTASDPAPTSSPEMPTSSAITGATTVPPPETFTLPTASSPPSNLPGADNTSTPDVGGNYWMFWLEADSESELAGYLPQDARDAMAYFTARHGLDGARIPEAAPTEAGAITSTADGPGPEPATGGAASADLYDRAGAMEIGFAGPEVDLVYMVASETAPFVAGSCDWDWLDRGWGSVEPVAVAPGVDGCVVTGEFYQRLVWARDGIAYAIEQIGEWVPVERLIELANAPSIAISEL